jgi:hypothetical protein
MYRPFPAALINGERAPPPLAVDIVGQVPIPHLFKGHPGRGLFLARKAKRTTAVAGSLPASNPCPLRPPPALNNFPLPTVLLHP